MPAAAAPATTTSVASTTAAMAAAAAVPSSVTTDPTPVHGEEDHPGAHRIGQPGPDYRGALPAVHLDQCPFGHPSGGGVVGVDFEEGFGFVLT